jgi:hypothetical protein
MILFHGSNIDFDKVSLDFAKDRRDFGKGFYTTTIKEQATDWAEIICRRYKTKTAYLYTFEFSAIDLTVKTFNTMTKNWLDFILENRIKGGTNHNYDIVSGPVANDKTVNTLNLYLSNELSLKETLDRLTYMQANDQLSFHTKRAIDSLVFIRREKWTL